EGGADGGAESLVDRGLHGEQAADQQGRERQQQRHGDTAESKSWTRCPEGQPDMVSGYSRTLGGCATGIGHEGPAPSFSTRRRCVGTGPCTSAPTRPGTGSACSRRRAGCSRSATPPP